MIKLHQFSPAFGVPNPSPFCLKIETYLRLNKIDYETVPNVNPSKAPKGKLPYIRDGDQVIADSHFILHYLKQKYGDPMGEGLTEQDRMSHHVLARMLDEHLYFAVLALRWTVPENAIITREAFFGEMNPILKKIIFAYVQRSLVKSLHGEGMGRHSRQEIERLAVEDINALSVVLGEAEFYGGDRPREIDCTAWSYITNIIETPFEGPVKDVALAKPNLTAYNERVGKLAFPEYFDMSK